MEPLPITLRPKDTVAEAARRLRAHRAVAAPLVSSGRAAGLLTRAQAENALRHGLGGARVADLVCGGAPRVPPSADLAAMRRASIGIAPGVVVGAARGELQGVVTRHHLEEAIARHVPAHSPPDWLLGRNLGPMMDALLGPERSAILKRAGGFAGAEGMGLLLAGGVVRDLLLRKPPRDLDLVVEGDGVMFAEELATILQARVTRHEAFGTAAISLPGGGRIDIASARRETYDTPSMLPHVTPGSLLEDLLRRDVTINSMAIRLDGALYGRLTDGLGGEKDLRAGVLRVNHMLSITEDPTRAFRIARLAGRLGFSVSEETLGSLALARRARSFEALTGERLFREFSLATAEESPAAALSRCADLGLLEHLGPGVRWNAAAARAVARLADGLRGRLFGKTSFDLPADRALLILMLLSSAARPAQREELARRLRVTGEAARRLSASAGAAAALNRALSRAVKPSRIVRLCEAAGADVVGIAWSAAPPGPRRALELYLEKLSMVRPAVTGETLRRMGLPQGPGYSEILEALRLARLDGRVDDDASELRLARRLVRGRSRRQRREN